jgi:hypothetical protein
MFLLASLSLSRLEDCRSDFNSRGYAIVPSCLMPETLGQLRGEIGATIQRIVTTNRTECEIRSHDPDGILSVSGLDLESLVLYDAAREKPLLDFVEFLLGMASIAIHVKYFRRRAYRQVEPVLFQAQATHLAHFKVPALSIQIPLDEKRWGDSAEVNRYIDTKPADLVAHRPVEHPETDWAATIFPGKMQAAVVPVGGAVIHHSYALHSPCFGYEQSAGEVLVLNYRQSPFRQAARSQRGDTGP